MAGRWLALVVVQVLIVAASFVVGFQVGSYQPSQCASSEDSCVPRYDGESGRWEVHPVVP